jgi:hypothetical protein
MRAESNRVRKSCNRVVPSSKSYVQDTFLRRHLTHAGLSPEHYQRQMSALFVTVIAPSLLLKEYHLDLPFATLATGRAGHLSFARIVA